MQYHIIAHTGPITVSVPFGGRVTVEYEGKTEIHYGERRKRSPPPRWVESVRAWVPTIAPRRRKGEERRDPSREMYQYGTSADQRIRALERREDKAGPGWNALKNGVRVSYSTTTSCEQQARDMLERMGWEEAQNLTAGDVVELANLICDRRKP